MIWNRKFPASPVASEVSPADVSYSRGIMNPCFVEEWKRPDRVLSLEFQVLGFPFVTLSGLMF